MTRALLLFIYNCTRPIHPLTNRMCRRPSHHRILLLSLRRCLSVCVCVIIQETRAKTKKKTFSKIAVSRVNVFYITTIHRCFYFSAYFFFFCSAVIFLSKLCVFFSFLPHVYLPWSSCYYFTYILFLECQTLIVNIFSVVHGLLFFFSLFTCSSVVYSCPIILYLYSSSRTCLLQSWNEHCSDAD